MKKEDAYFAGLFDGEGSFSITWANKDTYINFSPKMCMSLKYGSEVLEKLQERFGGKIWHYKDGMSRWYLGKKELLRAAANALIPYLEIKKKIGIKFLKILDLFPKSRQEKWTEARIMKVRKLSQNLNPTKKRLVKNI